MYRSNDIVRLTKGSIFVRPFVKVGEEADLVKVHKFLLEDEAPAAVKKYERRTLANHTKKSDRSDSSAIMSEATAATAQSLLSVIEQEGSQH